jgi:heme-degrading monooxygenase HmoA
MSIIRMIHTTFPAAMSAQAERNWKEKCAPLMIQQHGCLSERLLRCGDVAGEYISYSEWDSEESIRTYLRSEAHREIKRLNTNIQGAHVVVKMYEEVS